MLQCWGQPGNEIVPGARHECAMTLPGVHHEPTRNSSGAIAKSTQQAHMKSAMSKHGLHAWHCEYISSSFGSRSKLGFSVLTKFSHSVFLSAAMENESPGLAAGGPRGQPQPAAADLQDNAQEGIDGTPSTAGQNVQEHPNPVVQAETEIAILK